MTEDDPEEFGYGLEYNSRPEYYDGVKPYLELPVLIGIKKQN